MPDMAGISVTQTKSGAGGRTFAVTVDDGRGAASFTVTLSSEDHGRLSGDPAKVTPEKLVEESFAFLLEREPKEAILSSFALPLIARYFPEYPAEIARRLSA